MTICYFIAGTDTDCGKTTVTLDLINKYQQQGKKVIALKPIAAGINQQGKNQDAVLLQQANSVLLDYSMINPYLFKAPISPHLAAKKENKTIDIQYLKKWFNTIKKQADIVLIEGAGGWYAPISKNQTMADIAIQLEIPIILVVGMKLGCLNHALLTIEAIQKQQIPLAGWIANQIDLNMAEFQNNLDTLKEKIAPPFIDLIEFKITTKI